MRRLGRKWELLIAVEERRDLTRKVQGERGWRWLARRKITRLIGKRKNFGMKIDGRRRKHVSAQGDFNTCLRTVIRPFTSALKRSVRGPPKRIKSIRRESFLLSFFLFPSLRLCRRLHRRRRRRRRRRRAGKVARLRPPYWSFFYIQDNLA